MPYARVTVALDATIGPEAIKTAAAIAAAHDARLVIAASYVSGKMPSGAAESLKGEAYVASPCAANDQALHQFAHAVSREYGIQVGERAIPQGTLYRKLIREANTTDLMILPQRARYFGDVVSTVFMRRRHNNVLFVAPENEVKTT